MSSPSLESTEDKTAIFRGNEQILLIGDDPKVKDVLENQLQYLGYRVITAENGADAIPIYKNKINKIDLVIIDFLMPDNNEKEIFRALKKINPGIKAIISSGFSRDGLAAELLNEGVKGFLHKPVKIEDLSKIVFEILHR